MFSNSSLAFSFVETIAMDKREEMALLMEEFLNSGQSQKEFSASRGIALPILQKNSSSSLSASVTG
jgi:hypothetical protein